MLPGVLTVCLPLQTGNSAELCCFPRTACVSSCNRNSSPPRLEIQIWKLGVRRQTPEALG